MPDLTPPAAPLDLEDPDDESIVQVRVSQELEKAAQFARTFDPS